MNSDNKSLYRTTTSDSGLVYTPQWFAAVLYDEKFYEFAWCKITKEDKPDFVIHDVRVIIDRKIVNKSDHKELFNLVKQIRMREVYDDFVDNGMIETITLNAVKSVDQMDVEKVADLVENIYRRVDNGEFVGQYQDLIYIQDVAEILQCDFDTVLKAIETVLIPEKRLSLNGFIFSEYKDPAIEREAMYKATGHKDISVSDFGYWACRACGKNGDDWDNPRDFDCV